MAAPCRRMASRSLFQLFSAFSRTAVGNTRLRQFTSTPVSLAALQSKIATKGASPPWTLVAAVCLQRLPVVTMDLSPIEERFGQMMQEMELEKSLLSDHELRLLYDAETLRRKQSANYDSDEENDGKQQDIVLAQDMEDMWEQRLQNFQPEARVRADVDEDLTSSERCLADSLLLLAEQQLAGEKVWLLPQAQWQEGETLRQTAERTLASLPAAFKATFLSNAPCGVYKCKLPKAAWTESSIGTKVFFFRAILSDRAAPAAPNASFLWVKKSEMQRYLKPAYTMKVERFILDL